MKIRFANQLLDLTLGLITQVCTVEDIQNNVLVTEKQK